MINITVSDGDKTYIRGIRISMRTASDEGLEVGARFLVLDSIS